jgi:t-SNARE complex subunit (syntaxin)
MASLVSATNGDLNEEEALQRALRESKALHIAEKQIQSDATIAKLLFTRLNGYNTVNYSIKERNERNTAKKDYHCENRRKGFS